MFRKIVLTAAVLAASLTAANAAPLTKADKGYVNIDMGSVVFFGKCDGYSAVGESMVKLGDKLGISNDIPAATGAAIKVLFDLDYEHDDLIPEVTQFARGALNTFLKESKAKNFCSSMGKTFVDNDMVTKD